LGDRVTDDVLDAIAVWRIVRLIQRDSITADPREKLINRYGHMTWTELLSCPWCAGIWVGAGVVLARAAAPRLWGMIARGLAFSAGAGVITGLVDKLDD
jgi:hypothetical protein